MKILLIVPLFPPDKGVSTLRAKFFYDQLSKTHTVDILKIGDETDFSGQIKTIDKIFFSKLTTTLRNIQKIKRIAGDLLKNYDCIIVSAPPYNLYTLGNIAASYGIPVIYDYRDQPDLIYYDKTKNKPWNIPHRWLLLKVLEFYVHTSFKKAHAVLCVGQLSATLLQNRFKRWKNIYNCHNGFMPADLFHRPKQHNHQNTTIKIGWSGSIYPFRDSPELREILKQLDSLAKTIPVSIMHWGTTNPQLDHYISSLRHLDYQQLPPIERQEYLNEMYKMDAFILACSESLIWEPTTTVFDYILFDKPVIYAGLRNNEAFNILRICDTKILESNTLSRESLIQDIHKTDISKKLLFSREYQFQIVETLLTELEKKRCY